MSKAKITAKIEVDGPDISARDLRSFVDLVPDGARVTVTVVPSDGKASPGHVVLEATMAGEQTA